MSFNEKGVSPLEHNSTIEWLREYKWRILSVLGMFIVGVLFLTIGFWKTVLLLVLCTIGLVIGFAKDKTETFLLFIDKIRR